MNSITLFNNTLIKLIARSGTESQRQSVILDVGEFGYTTDSNRLYIGDGVTVGGFITGNIFKGYSSNILGLTNVPRPGDSAFDTSRSTLYIYNSGATSNINSWSPVGGFYTAGNGTITINSTNQIQVSALSAYNISTDAIENSLTITSGRVALSSRVSVDEIVTRTSTNLKLPTNLTLGTQNYRLTAAVVTNGYLRTDAAGNLEWSTANSLVSANSATLTLGKGLTGAYAGVASNQFPLSGNVSITPIFAPTAYTVFTQGLSTVRSSRIANIEHVPVADALAALPTINGLPLVESTSRFDHPASGAYDITTADTFDTGTVVVDVNIVNGTYSYDTTENQIIFSPSIDAYVQVINQNKIRVVFYSIATKFNQSDSKLITSTRTIRAALTPGTNSVFTRFSVSIYG